MLCNCCSSCWFQQAAPLVLVQCWWVKSTVASFAFHHHWSYFEIPPASTNDGHFNQLLLYVLMSQSLILITKAQIGSDVSGKVIHSDHHVDLHISLFVPLLWKNQSPPGFSETITEIGSITRVSFFHLSIFFIPWQPSVFSDFANATTES